VIVKQYDIVIIGAGPGGYVAAIRGAQLGASVALVEGDSVGGTCLNRGCIPTKALVRSAEVYETTRRAAEFGVTTGEVELDWETVMSRKAAVVERLVGGVKYLLKGNGVDLYEGWARMLGPKEIEVTVGGETERLEAKNVIIATGSDPAMPPVSEESLAHTIGSTEALSLDHVPETLLIIGGGVIAVEFACIYAAFGSTVQMVKRSPLILPPVDEEIARRLTPMLKRRNITVNHGIYVSEITDEGGTKVLTAKKDGEPVRFEAQDIMVAIGRVPRLDGIDVRALGLERNRNGIKTNGRMETNLPGVYAIGDVVGRTYLASVASAEGLAAVDNICGHPREMDYAVVPECVFSSPEAAGVGLKEKGAKEAGHEVKVSKFPYAALGKALALGETDGFIKMIADAATGKVLGVHMLGAHACDLIHEAAMAIHMGATAEQVALMVHGHPTLAELTMEAAHGAAGQAIHVAARGR